MKRKSINRWIIRCFLIILLLSMIASNIANLYEIRANTIQHEKELAEICAGNVTTSLNYLWKDSDENEADEELRTDVRRVLEILCGTYGLDHIYVYGMDAQTPSRYVCLFFRLLGCAEGCVTSARRGAVRFAIGRHHRPGTGAIGWSAGNPAEPAAHPRRRNVYLDRALSGQ